MYSTYLFIIFYKTNSNTNNFVSKVAVYVNATTFLFLNSVFDQIIAICISERKCLNSCRGLYLERISYFPSLKQMFKFI